MPTHPTTRWSRVYCIILLIYWLALFCGTHMPVQIKGLPSHSDKLMHFVAYAGLAFLLALTCHGLFAFSSRAAWIMLAVVMGYGVLDELLQIPVPGRHSDIQDWFADSAGALLGLAAFLCLNKSFPLPGVKKKTTTDAVV